MEHAHCSEHTCLNFSCRYLSTAPKHPLRAIRAIMNEALSTLDTDFAGLYSRIGRPPIPPEQLLLAMLLQLIYAIRSERLLVERLDFDLSFRWFVGLGVDDRVWDASTFSKNRDRLLDGDVAVALLAAILDQPRVNRLLSTEHFSVDGTLIEAWASMKSFRPKDGGDGQNPPPNGGSEAEGKGGRNGEVDFHGEKRSNATHASTTDPDAMLYRKSPGTGAVLCYMGHVLMENRNGLVVDAETTRVSGHAERMAAVEMIKGVTSVSGKRHITIGADRDFDTRDFVEDLRELGATPHVAQNTAGRRSAIDGRTTRHPGYAASIRVRKRIEEVFGWIKGSAGQRKAKVRGLAKVRFAFTFAAAAYKIVRLPKLLTA